ncbi:MAG: hypothetical protein IJ689_07050 [Alphaproteobacteria bacterium]|nr:hypothetical protein [Alphaproteobacteria bacterium]
MKLIINLLVLLGIGLAFAWFAYDLPPKAVYYKIKNSVHTPESVKNAGDAASRFSEVIQNNYNAQDMTEQHQR